MGDLLSLALVLVTPQRKIRLVVRSVKLRDPHFFINR